MSGDDHSPTERARRHGSNFDRYKALSPAGLRRRQLGVRARDVVHLSRTAPLTNAQASELHVATGFEVALHPNFGIVPDDGADSSRARRRSSTPQLAQFAAEVPEPAARRSRAARTASTGRDWALDGARSSSHTGIRLDGNYYHYPGAWIGAKPGFLNGGGFPMRFADTDGTPIDVYQENTNMTDESGQAYPATIDALLDNALGPNGYYGAFGVEHAQRLTARRSRTTKRSSPLRRRAACRSSPYKQLLDWTDGRNSSTIRGLQLDAAAPSRSRRPSAPARTACRRCCRSRARAGTLSALTCGGSARRPTRVQTIKGVQYAMFDTVTGTCQATYS